MPSWLSCVAHAQIFINCIKSRQRPNADLETVGQPSSLLCHMGNVASRVGRKLVFDAKTETFDNDKEANSLRNWLETTSRERQGASRR